MDKVARFRRALIPLLASVFVLCALKEAAAAPRRDFALLSEYTHVVVGEEKEWEFDVKVENRGKQDEEILLDVTAPKGWKAGLFKKWDGYEVRAVKVPYVKDSNSLLLSLRVTPPEKVQEGSYTFVIHGRTRDGTLRRDLNFTLTLKKGEVARRKARTIELVTEYPSLKQPAGENFEFIIEVKNQADKARVFDLLAEIPYGWGAYCTPRWEEEKRISALKVDSKGSEWVRFVLVPPPNVTKGEYPVAFQVQTGKEKASIDLKAIVIGTYKLRLGTEAEVLGTGETRNIKAIAGKEKRFVLYLWNEGSAPISDVNFYSTKPKDWEVSFEPKKIPTLKPTILKSPNLQKVMVTIKPKAKAIPGDYLVSLTALGKEDKGTMELRVTVGKPVTWGWIGIGIVLAVVIALIGVFIKLGRR